MTQAPTAESIKRDIVVMGASAGGVEALISIFQRFPQNLPAVVVVVLHRHPLYNVHLEKVLGRRAVLPLVEVREERPLNPGTISIAPPDAHLILTREGMRIDRGAKEHFTRPAVDPLFRSAAAIYGPRVTGVLLTGGGDDGVRGLIDIKAAAGISIVQNPDEAKASSMPMNALLYDHVDLVLSLHEIPSAIAALAQGESVHHLHKGRSWSSSPVSKRSGSIQ